MTHYVQKDLRKVCIKMKTHKVILICLSRQGKSQYMGSREIDPTMTKNFKTDHDNIGEGDTPKTIKNISSTKEKKQ